VRKELKIALVLAALGSLLTLAAFVMAFTTAEVREFGFATLPGKVETAFSIAPPELQPGDGMVNYGNPWFSQKIFYIHVPLAEASLLTFIFAAVFSVLFLVKKKKSYDTRARVGMEATMLFTLGTLVTGSLWTVIDWLGGRWNLLGREFLSDPRLATYTIMFVMIIAYFVLRNSIDDPERRATYSAVYASIAWITAPISFFITRLVDSSHPEVFNSPMDPSNLIPFILAQIGMLMFGYAVYTFRVAEERTRDELMAIKESFED
jgi:heme exporter protein C